MNYAVMARMRFIDFLLDHYGTLNRSAIMDYFGVSQPQASLDVRMYLDMSPMNMEYDKYKRCYIKTENFNRLFP